MPWIANTDHAVGAEVVVVAFASTKCSIQDCDRSSVTVMHVESQMLLMLDSAEL